MGIRILCVLLACATAAEAAPPVGTVAVIERPVARVDEAVLWQSDYDARATSVDPKDRLLVFDGMIEEMLQVAEGMRQKITVDRSEVLAALDEIKTQNKLDEAGLDAALKQAGYTRPRYERDLANQLIRLRAVNQLVSPRVLVTDDAITAEAKVRGMKVPVQQPDIETIRRDLRRAAIDKATTQWISELRSRAWIEKHPPPAAAPKLKWSELDGKVKSVRLQGVPDVLRKDVEAAAATAKGRVLDDLTRDIAETVLKLPGVADVAVSGVQVKGGVELLVEVKPQPALKRVTAIEKGGSAIALGIAAPQTGGPLDPLRMQALAATLRSRYVENGFFDVAVTWRADAVPGGVEVVVEVTPGRAATIGGVAFKGAKLPAKTLEAQIAKYLVAGQPATADKIEVSALTLSAYYWDLGYANVKVVSPKPAAGRNVLVFEIVEGPQYWISSIDVKGVPAGEHAEIKKLFGVKPGDMFSRTAAAEGRKRVTEALTAAGKRNVEVSPLTKVDSSNSKISFTLEISFSP